MRRSSSTPVLIPISNDFHYIYDDDIVADNLNNSDEKFIYNDDEDLIGNFSSDFFKFTTFQQANLLSKAFIWEALNIDTKYFFITELQKRYSLCCEVSHKVLLSILESDPDLELEYTVADLSDDQSLSSVLVNNAPYLSVFERIILLQFVEIYQDSEELYNFLRHMQKNSILLTEEFLFAISIDVIKEFIRVIPENSLCMFFNLMPKKSVLNMVDEISKEVSKEFTIHYLPPIYTRHLDESLIITTFLKGDLFEKAFILKDSLVNITSKNLHLLEKKLLNGEAEDKIVLNLLKIFCKEELIQFDEEIPNMEWVIRAAEYDEGLILGLVFLLGILKDKSELQNKLEDFEALTGMSLSEFESKLPKDIDMPYQLKILFERDKQLDFFFQEQFSWDR